MATWKITEQDLQEKVKIDKRNKKLTCKFKRFLIHLAEDLNNWVEEACEGKDGDFYKVFIDEVIDCTDKFLSFNVNRKNNMFSMTADSHPDVYDLDLVKILGSNVVFYEHNQFDNTDDGIIIPLKYVLNYDLMKKDYLKFVKNKCDKMVILKYIPKSTNEIKKQLQLHKAEFELIERRENKKCYSVTNKQKIAYYCLDVKTGEQFIKFKDENSYYPLTKYRLNSFRKRFK